MKTFREYLNIQEVSDMFDKKYSPNWKRNHPFELLDDNKMRLICSKWTKETTIDLNKKLPSGHPCPYCEKQEKSVL